MLFCQMGHILVNINSKYYDTECMLYSELF